MVHFMYRRLRDMLVVLEEGNHPLLRCIKCDSPPPWRSMNGKHYSTVICAKGA